jgi:hypothetical protein
MSPAVYVLLGNQPRRPFTNIYPLNPVIPFIWLLKAVGGRDILKLTSKPEGVK